MIYVGIDDTDTLDTPGTNQLARALVARLAGRFSCTTIVRHQLLLDPRVPFTSKNGSASITLEPRGPFSLADLIGELRRGMMDWFNPGSDPGLCVAVNVPKTIRLFGRRCKEELLDQREARTLAAEYGLHLEGLGGTKGGVIGALAAVGLIGDRSDGRVVQWQSWPDNLSGLQDIAVVRARGVAVRSVHSDQEIKSGVVDVGKHLRPNLRAGQIVLFVEPAGNGDAQRWQAVRLT